MKGACAVRIKTVVGVMAAVMLVGFSANQAMAQRHGISVQKGCDGPLCIGDTTNCTFLVSHNDGYGDTTMIMEAYDQLDTDGDGTFETRIPASGNLPIMEVGGNTTCTVGGSLPCNLGPQDLGAGLEPGFVIFQQNEYVVGPNDVSPLQDQAHVIWKDLCDAPGTSNCSTAVNDANAPAATMFPICNDDDACTNDSCDGGECSFESVCADPNYDCDDSNVCTADLCDDTMDGCCAHEDIPCEARACYNNTGCDPTDGCQYESVCTDPTYCDDSNVCTADSCDEGVDGCCNHEDIPCEPRACYNNTGCDPTDGCQYESVCTDPAYCDDSNACTIDTCDESAGGCCTHEPVVCEERPCYVLVGCDPTEGCQYESVCSDPGYCDDSNVCTADSCDESADGCCTHEDIPCEPRACYNNTGCDPTDGCQYESVCTDPTYCDDHNVCTTDSCDEGADGCCAHEDIPCEPRACYNLVGCDPVNGCQYEPVVCDDQDPCTEDSCDPATGACVYMDIIPPPPGCVEYAGCTPGFWKQRQHLQYWVGYNPTDLWEDVFGVDAIILDGKTLLEAAGTGGGGEAALGRHAVAALLNSTNDEVDYYYSTAQVIAMVQEAYATGNFNSIKNMLAAQNELGCTVDTSGQKNGDSGHGWHDGR